MKLIEFNNLIQTLGWVLLHSLWQGLIVYGLFLIFQRAFRSSSSTIKYFIGVTSMATILIAAIVTFFLLLEPVGVTEQTFSPVLSLQASSNLVLSFQEISLPEIALTSLLWINRHLPEIVVVWMFGTIFFGCRLLLAGWYAARIQKGAQPIDDLWYNRLQEFAMEMGIKKRIALAESHFVDSPMLIGYLKPVILLPFGIMSGLTVAQVEAVLLHELAHVKRADYVVNFVQSIMEVIFFFNPFVWAISSQIRIGREMCCDDTVVKWVNPSDYAHALYKLEEVRWPAPFLALAAVGNKNQLLQRIKRIMEPVKTKKEVGGKTIPAVLIIALILASGLFVKAHRPEHSDYEMLPMLSSDTTRKDLKKAPPAKRADPPAEAPDVQGAEQPESAEEVDELETTGPVIAIPGFLEVPGFDIAPPAIAQLDMLGSNNLMGLNDRLQSLDTLPNLGLTWSNEDNWQDFEKEFTEKFQSQFSEFYRKNKPEFEKMMKEMQGKLEKMHGTIELQYSADARRNAEKEMDLARHNLRQLMPRQREMLRLQERNGRELEMALAKRNEALALSMDRHGKIGGNMKSFETALTTELVKDGYLGKDDTIKNFSWEDDGGTVVNGKKIKDSDKPKYKRLRQKYLEQRGRFRHDE